MKCLICLEEKLFINKICKNCGARVHKKCQKKWGSFCIVCKKNTGINTPKFYRYTPDSPEFSQEEIDEQLRIEELIQRERDRQNRINEQRYLNRRNGIAGNIIHIIERLNELSNNNSSGGED